MFVEDSWRVGTFFRSFSIFSFGVTVWFGKGAADNTHCGDNKLLQVAIKGESFEATLKEKGKVGVVFVGDTQYTLPPTPPGLPVRGGVNERRRRCSV